MSGYVNPVFRPDFMGDVAPQQNRLAAGFNAIWPASNPVGTETTQHMQSATPTDQIAFMRPDGTPVMQSDLARAREQVQTGMQTAPTMALGMMGTTRILPARLTGAMEAAPGYVYHATNAERLQDIAETGKLQTHKPGDFTEQDIWPDGSTEKRNYFTPNASNTWQFAPEEGTPVLLRMKQEAHPVQSERGTGDLYSTKPVPAQHLEYHGDDGNWHPVSNLRQQQSQ